jgi:hypothetical protein
MKRIIVLMLALVLMASFVACNEGGEVTTEAPETTAAPTVTDAPTEDTTAAETEPAFAGYTVTVTVTDGTNARNLAIAGNLTFSEGSAAWLPLVENT